MEFKKWFPHPLLQSYIRYYTYMEIGAKEVWTSSAIVPTGCSVTCVIVGDQLSRFKDQHGSIHPQYSLNFTGQATRFFPFSFYGQHNVVSVIFNPFGANRILGMEQSYFRDQLTQDFFDLLPPKDRGIRQQFLDCEKPDETVCLLDQFFLRLIGQQKEKNNSLRIAYFCEHLMHKAHEPLLLKDLSRETGFSKSSLERNFKEIVGIGVKQYHRILRFQKLLNHIREQKDFLHWTEVAYRFGFYDQAHFIKDFKTFYGKTPTSFSTNDKLISDMVQ